MVFVIDCDSCGYDDHNGTAPCFAEGRPAWSSQSGDEGGIIYEAWTIESN